jgi:hypothetical protein
VGPGQVGRPTSMAGGSHLRLRGFSCFVDSSRLGFAEEYAF